MPRGVRERAQLAPSTSGSGSEKLGEIAGEISGVEWAAWSCRAQWGGAGTGQAGLGGPDLAAWAA